MAAADRDAASPCGTEGEPKPRRVRRRSSPSSVSGPTVLENCVEKVMPLKRGGRSKREPRSSPRGWLEARIARREVARAVVIAGRTRAGAVAPDERVEERQDQPEDPHEH